MIILVLVIYWPGISGPFVLDDFPNLSSLASDGGVNSWQNFLAFVFGNSSGPTGRPVSMLSFLIDGQDWPPNIASFKYSNILIHVLTGLVLCWMLSILFDYLELSRPHSAYLALSVTAIWLLHPLNSTTTLYVVQRMTQLMSLFALASLGFYLKGRICLSLAPKRAVFMLCLAMFPFALLSVLSKENGALLLLLIVVFELSFFRTETKTRFFKFWYGFAVLLPLFIVIGYLALNFSSNIEGYDYRHFSLFERLLTESRVLLIYLGKIISPASLSSGLFHDDLEVSGSLFQPWTTLPSILILVLSAAAAIRLRKRQPMFFFGLFWFLSMQFLESSYIPLELYFEHRNYMAMIGPLIALSWYLYACLQLDYSQGRLKLCASIFAVFLLFLSWQTWQQASLWGHTGNLMASWAYENPRSSRAQIAYGDFLLRNDAVEEGLARIDAAHELLPQEITVLLHRWNKSCEYGASAPYSIKAIVEMKGLEYFHNDINFHFQDLLDNVRGSRCDLPSIAEISLLFDKVFSMPLSDNREAGLHVIYSEFFVHYRRLNPALIELSRAFELNTIPLIPIRQAILSASAENYSDALVFLQRAREADNQAGFLKISAEAEIIKLESDYRRQLDSQ